METPGDKIAAEEKVAAEKKAADEKAAEKKAADEKAADEKAAAEDGKEEEEGNDDPSPLEESKKIVGEMKKQNKLMNDNLKKAEKIAGEMMLSGRAPAGKEKTQEEIEVEAARKLLEGTGYGEQLFPTAEQKAAGEKK